MRPFFVPEIKNKAEAKTIRLYFEQPESFDRDCFDCLRERTSTNFSKAIWSL